MKKTIIALIMATAIAPIAAGAQSRPQNAIPTNTPSETTQAPDTQNIDSSSKKNENNTKKIDKTIKDKKVKNLKK